MRGHTPFLLDGAIGTELVARGLRVREECPERWNLDRAGMVYEVHRAYVEAGAEAIQTNTFGATRPRLRPFGLEARLPELIEAGVALARRAVTGQDVIGSLGPTGETLPLAYTGDLQWLEEVYAESAALLARFGVAAIHLETQFHPIELTSAVRGVRAGAPQLPLIVSIALMPGASGLETPHGVPISKMVKALQAEMPDAVGANCAIEAERMRAAVIALRDALNCPIWAKPQAKISTKCVTGSASEMPEVFAQQAIELVRAGAVAVGGCCGVGPKAIAALRRELDRELGKQKVAS